MEWLEGGCHCGAVRFRVCVRKLEAIDCNCSICTMKGIVHVIVPPEDFVLVRGSEALTTYTFGTHTAKHHFCHTCGMHAFYEPRSHPGWFDINARCLDGDALSRFTVKPFDGRHWEANIDELRT